MPPSASERRSLRIKIEMKVLNIKPAYEGKTIKLYINFLMAFVLLLK
jgi:hypothetical protein